MKRTTLYVALASALSLSSVALANESSWSKATQRVERMNDQQAQGSQPVKQAQQSGSAATSSTPASDSD